MQKLLDHIPKIVDLLFDRLLFAGVGDAVGGIVAKFAKGLDMLFRVAALVIGL